MNFPLYKKTDSLWIPISALNEFIYCPRNCFLSYVLGEKKENYFILDGKFKHEKLHAKRREKRDLNIRLSRVYVFSNKLRVSGFTDILELSSGKKFPIEFKRGRTKNCKGDKIQLCAQGICLEEITNERIGYGYIFYISSRKRTRINFDENLRNETKEVIRKVRKLFSQDKIPEPLNNKKCRGCSLLPICLPKETRVLKDRKLIFK